MAIYYEIASFVLFCEKRTSFWGLFNFNGLYSYEICVCWGEQLDQKNKKRNKIMSHIRGKLGSLWSIL
jgi:hypothetical protein